MISVKPVAITVSELNKYIKNKVDEDEFLNNVYVKGKISNFKHHYTGHMYFTLKDESSLIKCVMFKSSTSALTFTPKDGMKVLVFGTVAVYEAGGAYQIYCKDIQEDGIGDLYKKYEELKDKLEKEGLFEQKHKKKIPLMPKTIVVMLISYLAIKILDFASGLLKTWKNKNYKSSKMRDGLIKWIAELIGVIFVILIDMMLGLEFYLCGLTLALFV